MNTFIKVVIGIPKIIDDLRPRLLAEARKMLLTDGGRSLTIRSVAASCDVAVGTVYNYFRSKDELMAHVILEDWRAALSALREATAAAPDVLTGLRCVDAELVRFRRMYTETWRQYASHDIIGQLGRRHPLLVSQLAEIIATLLERHHALWTPCLPSCLAETLLTTAARTGLNFELITPILERLIERR